MVDDVAIWQILFNLKIKRFFIAFGFGEVIIVDDMTI